MQTGLLQFCTSSIKPRRSNYGGLNEIPDAVINIFLTESYLSIHFYDLSLITHLNFSYKCEFSPIRLMKMKLQIPATCFSDFMPRNQSNYLISPLLQRRDRHSRIRTPWI